MINIFFGTLLKTENNINPCVLILWCNGLCSDYNSEIGRAFLFVHSVFLVKSILFMR
jgi:hypothetical protein